MFPINLWEISQMLHSASFSQERPIAQRSGGDLLLSSGREPWRTTLSHLRSLCILSVHRVGSPTGKSQVPESHVNITRGHTSKTPLVRGLR